MIWNVFTNYIFHEAAFKHNYTEVDVRTAFMKPIFDGLLEDYDNKFLLTGFDANGNLIEIMYNLIDENTAYIFHVMECRKVFRLLRNQY